MEQQYIVIHMFFGNGLYQGTQLSPNHNGSSDDFPVVSPRIKLRDGRHLAYIERGVPKDIAKYKIVIVHGFGSSKEMNFLAPQVINNLNFSLPYTRHDLISTAPLKKIVLAVLSREKN